MSAMLALTSVVLSLVVAAVLLALTVVCEGRLDRPIPVRIEVEEPIGRA